MANVAQKLITTFYGGRQCHCELVRTSTGICSSSVAQHSKIRHRTRIANTRLCNLIQGTLAQAERNVTSWNAGRDGQHKRCCFMRLPSAVSMQSAALHPLRAAQRGTPRARPPRSCTGAPAHTCASAPVAGECIQTAQSASQPPALCMCRSTTCMQPLPTQPLVIARECCKVVKCMLPCALSLR